FFRGFRGTEGDLRWLGAALPSSGPCSMFHLASVTPEARRASVRGLKSITITDEDLAAAKREHSDGTEAEIIGLGSPQLSSDELREVAGLIDRTPPRIPVWAFTSRVVRDANPDARGIVPGRASGRALVSAAPFSFVGGVDPATGSILDGATGGTGERLDGRIFAFPTGKGSTVGSYVLYGLGKRSHGPAAIVNRRADAVVAVGATLAGIPMVDRVDVEGLRSGDRVVVDGDRGTVELPGIRGRRVV